ncbi:hypothetical protein AB0K74_37400, partial [Streptomyces sp. NPDC056159]|uniref:hypothetical protein n=1 Tax=Streptomyces sp. NPDC056159 TaxID=3155537 RepID=UPI0034480DEC
TRNAAHAHRFDRVRINGLNIGWTAPGRRRVFGIVRAGRRAVSADPARAAAACRPAVVGLMVGAAQPNCRWEEEALSPVSRSRAAAFIRVHPADAPGGRGRVLGF